MSRARLERNRVRHVPTKYATVIYKHNEEGRLAIPGMSYAFSDTPSTSYIMDNAQREYYYDVMKRTSIFKQHLRGITKHNAMSYELDLIATSQLELHEHYTEPRVECYFAGFRFRLECRPPLTRSDGALARWSQLTRGVDSLCTRREFARERSNTLFREWCAVRTYMKEEKHIVWCAPTRVSSWLLDASHITLDSRALALAGIANPFYESFCGFAGWYVAQNMDYETAPFAIVCESISTGAWQRFEQSVYADANNSTLREVATACADALRRATCEVSDEYDREEALAEALRRRGIPLQTARNWIVPREVDARLYVVDSLGNISGRDTICVE